MPLYGDDQSESTSGGFDGWSTAGRGCLLASCGRSLLREIALLRWALEDVVGRVSGQRLNANQFPTFLAKRVEVATSKGAAPLVADERLQTLAGDAPAIINIRNFISPLLCPV